MVHTVRFVDATLTERTRAEGLNAQADTITGAVVCSAAITEDSRTDVDSPGRERTVRILTVIVGEGVADEVGVGWRFEVVQSDSPLSDRFGRVTSVHRNPNARVVRYEVEVSSDV